MTSYFVVLIGAFTHLMPHPWWGFTAVGASLLFFGARRSPALFVLPVLVLAASDYYLTAFAYGFPFHVQFYLVTWAWYLGACWLGWAILRQQASAGRVVAASAASATSFFLVSNFVSCVGSTFYPHTLAGLTAAYTAGLPFYRNDLVSTTLLASALFGVPSLARKTMTEWQRRSLNGASGAGPSAA